jgi:hypothetical protein
MGRDHLEDNRHRWLDGSSRSGMGRRELDCSGPGYLVLLASKEVLYSVEFIAQPIALKLHVGPNFNIRLCECDTFEILPAENSVEFCVCEHSYLFH